MRLTAPKLGLNLRTTGAMHVTLYRTWRLSDLFTGPRGQVALRSRCGHYIFILWFLLFIFFSSPNLSCRRLDVYHTSTHGVALVRI